MNENIAASALIGGILPNIHHLKNNRPKRNIVNTENEKPKK